MAEANSRRPFVGGNWKCSANLENVKSQVEVLNSMDSIPAGVDVLIAPSAIHTAAVVNSVRKEVKVAAQNIHAKDYGAYTGELCAEMVKDFGLEWVILGHSERRHLFGELTDAIAGKVVDALGAGLKVIYCIGETLQEREADKTMEVVFEQLKALVDRLTKDDWNNIVVAYEPVWAIGTGKTASPGQAQEVHQAIRKWFSDVVSSEIASKLRIVYGGSVKGSNAEALIDEADIDGFLVGGASLKPEFQDIIRAAGK